MLSQHLDDRCRKLTIAAHPAPNEAKNLRTKRERQFVCNILLLGGFGFNAPSTFRLSNHQCSAISQWKRPSPEDPSALGMPPVRKLSLVENWSVRHFMFARVTLLNEKLTHGNAPTIRCGNITDGHLLGEFKARERKVTLNDAGAGHATSGILSDAACKMTEPTLFEIECERHWLALGNPLRWPITICAAPRPCDFFKRIHLRNVSCRLT
jgi:hypothetical protein